MQINIDIDRHTDRLMRG